MLGGWDGRLTVLLRKRVNRHVERCAICSRRRDQELTPSMLLGVAPVLALPLAAGLPAGLRDQVMHAVFGSSPAAVAHRAGLGQTPYSFGHHGFPQPVHPLQTPWWQVGSMHVSTAAGTATAAVAAVAAAGVTLVVVPHHHQAGHHPGGGASVVATGTSPASTGITAPSTYRPRAAGAPTVSAAATVGAGATPSDARPRPSSSSGELAPSVPASASESPADAAAGTLSVSPATLDITSPGTASITLTASGGQVDWSVSVPAGKTNKDDVVVTPTSGTLGAGGTIVVTVTVDSATKPKLKLTFSPGDEVVKVVVG
jgi:hypothetical protein